MQEKSIAGQIVKHIEKNGLGSIYTTTDFLEFGEYNSVRRALNRLEESGRLQRIMGGMYYNPKYISEIEEYEAPAPAEVAKTLAGKFNWSIAPSGETAQNFLGLTTQVPAKYTYISDGPYRKFTINNLIIEFKHRNNREISKMSPKSALVIQALKSIGKNNIDDNKIKIIARNLNPEEKEVLLKEARSAPVWIYETAKKIYAL